MLIGAPAFQLKMTIQPIFVSFLHDREVHKQKLIVQFSRDPEFLRETEAKKMPRDSCHLNQ